MPAFAFGLTKGLSVADVERCVAVEEELAETSTSPFQFFLCHESRLMDRRMHIMHVFTNLVC